MDANALEKMNDFFDFAALDEDSGLNPMCSTDGNHEPLFPTDHIATMDWAVDPAVTTGYLDITGHYDMHLHNAPQKQDYQQWSILAHTPQSIPSIEDATMTTRAGCEWQADTYTSGMDHMSHCEEPIPAHAPSSSFLMPAESAVSRDDDEGDLVGTMDVRVSPAAHGRSIAESTVILDVGLPPTRPTAPLRQASTASWKPASAKRKGPQSRIPFEARQILEDEFAANPYPHNWEMDIIAHQANLDVKKVRNWFNNTRARKKVGDSQSVMQDAPDTGTPVLKTKLSKDSLDTLDKQVDGTTQPPQPPLAVYLAQSYQEEAVELSAVHAAIEGGSLSGSGQDDAWSDSRQGRRGSAITSIASSEGTAPTTYTVSSSGSRSNISSFGRDRRRGRRRMAWKESPRQAINGVNSAGEPQKDLPFFCTFCPRAFKTKYEWVRHEDSVHALRTTWICCDTKPSAAIEACPFCGHSQPDATHMAGHKYQQCRSKPESQRTFYRRDHFIQHLHHVHFGNVKHPSVRVGCQARLLAAEGQNFGCKDLAMKWRRFGAPMKLDDPMLHCGFCGKKSKDWSERCEHVAEHLIARELDRAVWWSERKENHLENLYSASPYESFRCRYCQKVFTDIKEMNKHSHCRVWSCRFLRSFDDVAAQNAGPPLCPEFPSAKAHHCHLCGAGYRAVHVEHAQNYHRYRSCNQEFYTSEDAFLQHLHNFHGASQPGLLRGSGVIEQSFMRNKGASFEPVEFNESWQPCVMDLDVASVSPFVADNNAPALPVAPKKKDTPARKSLSGPKRHGEIAQIHDPSPQKMQRQRANTTASKADTLNPRFFRLSTYIPFRSSRIFYSRNTRSSTFQPDEQDVLEEVPKPHIASLAMGAGLVSMATARWMIRPVMHATNGMVELTIDDEEE
ncbi:Homeodomain-containing transcription factor [Pyrenophora tritici-repentis]|nr:Homeodomain-containing transcription factor [Pyrenophora tritici-repentis]